MLCAPKLPWKNEEEDKPEFEEGRRTNGQEVGVKCSALLGSALKRQEKANSQILNEEERRRTSSYVYECTVNMVRNGRLEAFNVIKYIFNVFCIEKDDSN